jgi:hypothetical protein
MKRTEKPTSRATRCGVSFDTVREIANQLAGAVEKTSYGTPAFFVGKTLFLRQHQDGESLVVRIEPAARELLVKTDPTTYSVTDHYLNYPLMLVRMATVERDELRELIVDAWQLASAASNDRRRKKRKGDVA